MEELIKEISELDLTPEMQDLLLMLYIKGNKLNI